MWIGYVWIARSIKVRGYVWPLSLYVWKGRYIMVQGCVWPLSLFPLMGGGGEDGGQIWDGGGGTSLCVLYCQTNHFLSIALLYLSLLLLPCNSSLFVLHTNSCAKQFWSIPSVSFANHSLFYRYTYIYSFSSPLAPTVYNSFISSSTLWTNRIV